MAWVETKSGLPRWMVDSERLFRVMLELFDVDLILDVGSFDGEHALRFCRPGARVVAFEAHPDNASAMRRDGRLAAAGIEVCEAAAWTHDGEIDFNLVDIPMSGDDWRNKISSTRARNDYDFDTRTVRVCATRLDSFVQESGRRPRRIALWIDVEGAAHEVIRGASGILADVALVHVEVETFSHWRDQHLLDDVLTLMSEHGFAAVGRGPGGTQFDVVLVNQRFARDARARVAAARWLAPVRYRAGAVKSWLRSARLRRLYPG